MKQFISYLNLPKSQAQTLREIHPMKERLPELSAEGLAPSRIYELLHGFSAAALKAAAASGSVTAAEHIQLYLNVLSHVKPLLSGEDLKQIGVPAGPKITEVLQAILKAKLDGKVSGRADEEKMAGEIMGRG
jgi:tRNA nucleotidyltransferase (CCA-adding enzyme)